MSQSNENTPAFRVLISAVTANLPGFTTDADNPEWNDRITITHTDGRRLYFVQGRYGQKPGTMSVSGDYPRDNGNDDPYVGTYVDPRSVNGRHFSINVSTSKTPEQIARDITRRLLPEYTETFGKIRERIDARIGHRASVEVVARMMQRALGPGTDNVRYNSDRSTATIRKYSSERGTTEVTVNSFDSVTIEARSLTPARAAAILALLAAE